jgi:hypothetical protein
MYHAYVRKQVDVDRREAACESAGGGNLNMPAGFLREVTRDDSSERMTHPAPDIDIPTAEGAVRSLLVALGQDPDAEHLKQTPRRLAAAFSELLTPDGFELTTFANEEGYDQLVLARDIPFQSLCEHHRRSIVKSAGHSLPLK